MVTPPVLFCLALLLLLAGAATARLRPGCRPGPVPKIAEAAALGAFLAIAAATLLIVSGRAGAATGGSGALLRLDTVGLTLALLISFIGWIIVRYARTYLDGETREGWFHALLSSALAGAIVVAIAGNLLVLLAAFAAVGITLQRLLRFFPERAEARRAARKFALAWSGGSLAFAMAVLLIGVSTGSSGIPVAAQALEPTTASRLAVLLIVVAALLKTASFPVHGWVTEVMEAPTPVSALLHAGIINAGGILLLRMADLVQANPGAMAILVMVGGFTALFGSAVLLTQSAVKTALAWSTVAQMGFLMLQCGLGLWTLALLHIVAHSLYKAHAFLSSGTAIEAVAFSRRPGPVAAPSPAAVAKSFGLAVLLYAAAASLAALVLGPKPPQAFALGAILIFGVAYLLAQGLADTAPRALAVRTAAASFGAAIAYFLFHALADALWQHSLPVPPVPGALEWALVLLALGSFGVVAAAQALFPLWAHHPSTAGLRVHLANGLYANALLDRLIGGFKTRQPT
ncbi:proton-conducting transporter membrane subunit [Prosthecomicrobium hirschii]|uniref:proton-conducting transporter transmembrane domain-containing protein n=1 Tax=Prosthecodimorpha hirschii TaxID=665126 RepID=UPI00221E88CE|nr:proton-conducting transporter membrane subunit [Prosthecomicrobium hirschii]MCW1842255.1 proton-conducting transporter membrane subunit [Prosthecomicrobium hirschii]